MAFPGLIVALLLQVALFMVQRMQQAMNVTGALVCMKLNSSSIVTLQLLAFDYGLSVSNH
jgi:flagellar biosynthesis protein FliR